jgi:hypothetical protein
MTQQRRTGSTGVGGVAERDLANAQRTLAASLARLGLTLDGAERLSTDTALAVADALDAQRGPA